MMHRSFLAAVVAFAPIVAAADTVGREVAVGAPRLDSQTHATDFIAALGTSHGYAMWAGDNVGGIQIALDGTPLLQTRTLYPLAPTDYFSRSSDALGDIEAVGDVFYASYRRAEHVVVRQIDSDREIEIDSGKPMSLTSSGAVLLATYNRDDTLYGALLDMTLHLIVPPFVISQWPSWYKPAAAAANGRILLLGQSGEAFLVATNGNIERVTPPLPPGDVALASNGASLFAVWNEKGRMAGRVLTDAGLPAGEMVSIAEGELVGKPSVAWDGTGYIATWIDDYNMYSRRLTPELSEPRLITDNSTQGRVVAGNRTGAFVCWLTLAGVVTVRSLEGNGRNNTINVGPTPQWDPAIASDGDQIVVAWPEGHALRIGRFSARGEALDGSGIVAAADMMEEAPQIAFDGVDYLLVWNRFLSGDRQVFGRFVTREATFRGDAFPISPPDQIYGVTLAWSGTHYIVTWNGGAAGVTTNGIVAPADPLEGDLVVYATSGAADSRIAMKSPAGVFVVATEPWKTYTDPHLHSFTLGSPRLACHGSEVVVTWLRSSDYFGMVTEEVWMAVLTPNGEVLSQPGYLVGGPSWLSQFTAAYPVWDGRAFRLFISDGGVLWHGPVNSPVRLTKLARTELLEGLFAAATGPSGTGRSAVAYSRYGVDPASGEVSRRVYLRIIESSPSPLRRRSAGH